MFPEILLKTLMMACEHTKLDSAAFLSGLELFSKRQCFLFENVLRNVRHWDSNEVWGLFRKKRIGNEKINGHVIGGLL